MDATDEKIVIEKMDRTTILTLNRENKLNAFDWETLRRMKSALVDFCNEPSQSVLVITGAGKKSFCTGADLNDFKEMSPELVFDWCKLGNEVFNFIADMPKPAIAAINGFALGGGLELALACDFRIACEHAILGFPEVTLGWVPGWGGIRRAARALGPLKAKELLMLGSRIKANEALPLGLLNKVVPYDDLIRASCDLARQLADKNPISLEIIKSMLQDGGGDPRSQANLLEALSVSCLSKTPYAAEKIESFQRRTGKRKD